MEGMRGVRLLGGLWGNGGFLVVVLPLGNSICHGSRSVDAGDMGLRARARPLRGFPLSDPGARRALNSRVDPPRRLENARSNTAPLPPRAGARQRRAQALRPIPPAPAWEG